MLRFKVEMNVGVAAERTFQLLSDLRRRKEWDQHYKRVPHFTLGGHFQMSSTAVGSQMVSSAVKPTDDLDPFLWCRECEAIMQVNEEDTLYRVTTPSVSKAGKDNDFILLASRRKPCDVRCGNTPPARGLLRYFLMTRFTF